ncbi:MAG: 30S ribosomal protein S16 [Clostridiales bacterium]|nr:30S ribosomal protein S16 [Clostridiales bacterium]
MVKIRLKRVGKKGKPFYHVVVADSRRARDGKVIEKIGTYDPMTQPSTININLEKVETWVKNGAQATETAKN